MTWIGKQSESLGSHYSECWRYAGHTACAVAEIASLTARLAEAEARVVPVHVIFDGPPSHESGRFVEVETPDGKSIRLGQWLNRGDGYWALVFNVSIDQTAGYEVAKEG